MTTAKHTPGPWDVTTVDHSSGGSGAVPSTLFRVGFPSQKDFTGHVADKCHGDSYANAHLIAAAPDLKAFAEKVRDFAREIDDDGLYQAADSVISKSEGRS